MRGYLKGFLDGFFYGYETAGRERFGGE